MNVRSLMRNFLEQLEKELSGNFILSLHSIDDDEDITVRSRGKSRSRRRSRSPFRHLMRSPCSASPRSRTHTPSSPRSRTHTPSSQRSYIHTPSSHSSAYSPHKIRYLEYVDRDLKSLVEKMQRNENSDVSWVDSSDVYEGDSLPWPGYLSNTEKKNILDQELDEIVQDRERANSRELRRPSAIEVPLTKTECTPIQKQRKKSFDYERPVVRCSAFSELLELDLITGPRLELHHDTSSQEDAVDKVDKFCQRHFGVFLSRESLETALKKFDSNTRVLFFKENNELHLCLVSDR